MSAKRIVIGLLCFFIILSVVISVYLDHVVRAHLVSIPKSIPAPSPTPEIQAKSHLSKK